MSEPVVVYTAKNPPEAHVLRAALEGAGIPTLVEERPTKGPMWRRLTGLSRVPRILVPGALAEDAIAILREMGAEAGLPRAEEDAEEER